MKWKPHFPGTTRLQALHLHGSVGGGGVGPTASKGALLLALARAKRWQRALQMLGEAGDLQWG